MTVAQIEALREDWKKVQVLRAVESAFDRVGFTSAYVDQTRKSVLSEESPRSKVVKDNVWGMIEVEPSHLRLLNSPLIQRMRGIRQLGFSYLTYPTAEHSRFVHSLGMYAVIIRFLQEFQRKGEFYSSLPEGAEIWNPEGHHVRLLGHAALLHDVGHMPFSHATELATSSNAEAFRCGPVTVDEFLSPAADRLNKTVPLAECLSLAVVLTDRFEKFYRDCVHRESHANDLLWIAALIAGVPPSPEMEGLANLISGKSIDADKVDYINRDSRACGIPVGIDVSRLFLRSALLFVQPADIERLRSKRPSTKKLIFVVNASGIDSIEEIVQSRTALYHRVYYHQTTRNSERLLAKALLSSAINRKAKNLKRTVDLGDVLRLWTLDDSNLLQELSEHEISGIASLGRRIQRRELPKRACIFSRFYARMIFDGPGVLPGIAEDHWRLIKKQVIGSRLEGLGSEKLKGPRLIDLENSIAKEARKIARILKKRGTSQAPGVEPDVVSILPMARLVPDRSESIVLEHSELGSSSANSISDEQMEATDIVKSKGYVLTDEWWREIVFIASRVACFQFPREKSEIEISPMSELGSDSVNALGGIFLDGNSVSRHVGLNKLKLERVTQKLETAGYFDGFPELAKEPVMTDQLQAAFSKLKHFNGQRNWSVTHTSIQAFVAQFPPRLRTAAARMIEKITVLGRDTVVPDIAAEIEKIQLEKTRGFIVGFSPDSGTQTRVYLENELHRSFKETNWSISKTIRAALAEAKPGNHLVLCDDNISSGTQATCQFKAWLNAPMSDEEKKENGIDKSRLPDHEIHLLKQLNVHLITAMGTVVGAAKVKDELLRLGLTSFQGVHFHRPFSPKTEALGTLEPFLADVGMHAYAWVNYGTEDLKKLHPKDRRKCRDNALGYDNAKGLACTLTNVPTGTVTALWSPGVYRGRAWLPLLLRRGYLNHLVLA